MDDETVRKEISIGFEYSDLHDDWVNPLREALDGIGPVQAAWRLGPETTSIWEIVLHLALWNENIVERVRSGEKVHPSEGSWPKPEGTDEFAWAAAKGRLDDSIDSVREMIKTTPLEKLVGAYGLADLFSRLTHMGYHLGQITKMREGMEKTE